MALSEQLLTEAPLQRRHINGTAEETSTYSDQMFPGIQPQPLIFPQSRAGVDIPAPRRRTDDGGVRLVHVVPITSSGTDEGWRRLAWGTLWIAAGYVALRWLDSIVKSTERPSR